MAPLWCPMWGATRWLALRVLCVCAWRRSTHPGAAAPPSQAKRAFSKGHSRRITMSRLSSAEVPAELRALFTRLNGLDYELYQFARAESESWRG